MEYNYAFEVHVHAPELNKIFYKGIDMTKFFGNVAKRLDRNYKNDVQFVREFIPKTDFIETLYYKIKKEYTSPVFQSYNHTFTGMVTNRKHLIKLRNKLRSKTIKGEECKITVKRIYKF